MVRRLHPIAERHGFGPGANDRTRGGVKYPGSTPARSVLGTTRLGHATPGSRPFLGHAPGLPGVLLPTTGVGRTTAGVGP